MAKSTAKASFKQTVEDYHSICTALKGGQYAPVYLLMGEESYYIDAICDLIATTILTPEEREFNQVTIYGKDSNGTAICEAARQYPMMAAYNIVIVKQAQQLAQIEELAHYFGKADMIPRSTILVLCYVGKSMDKRSVLYKRIKEYGTILESISPREYEITPWLYDLFRKKGLTIDDKGAAMLIENLGTNLPKINNEVDKLITSLPQGKRDITPTDIENNIGISKEFNTFELTKALSERNGKKALQIVDYFKRTRNDNIFSSFILLFNHYERIFTLGMMLWSARRKGQPAPSDSDIMRQLKLTSPIFVREYRAALSHYDTAKSFTALGLIREYDMKCKGVNTGSASTAELLQELILKLLSL